MKSIAYEAVVAAVADLCFQAAHYLPPDVTTALERAAGQEESPLGRSILAQCLENAIVAARESLPLCQDTGIAVYFVEVGAEVRIDGGLLSDAIGAGTAKGYTEAYLRASIVADPLFDRCNTRDNTPPVIHWSMVPGDGLSITLAPKGGGAENMSALAMLTPAEGRAGVVRFVTDTVQKAGGNPCPPTIVGVGIGGSFEKAAILAKQALLREVGRPHADQRYAALESEILDKINSSGIGPQGLGGRVTALAVHIEAFPCHIASLPVAVNLNCHAARHVAVRL
jgi:fumarate hydratase subunit alpha